jgi:hypothetical protein
MFKMGGSAGTGITTGLDKPRQNYQDAGPVNPLEQYPTDFFPQLGTREIKQDTPNVTMDTSAFSPGAELLKAFENRNTRPIIDPRFLIDFGLDFATRSPTGKGLTGLLSTAAASAKEPFKTSFKRKEADDAFGRKLKLAATQMDIDKKLKEEFAEKKFGRDLALALAKPQKVTYRAGIDTRTGERGFFTNADIEASGGKIQPIDNRMGFRFNTKTNVFEQVPLSQIEQEKTDERKATSIATQYNILTSLVGDMQTRLPTTVTGATGVGFGVVEGFADQFAQLAESLGIKDGLVIENEGAIDKYLKDKGFTEKAQSAATMKASVINLGYALAKIAEPDNPRLSEGDIIRQLNRINFGASRNVFSASLDQILKEELIRASSEIKGLKLNPDDFIGVKKEEKKDENKKDETDDNPAGLNLKGLK